MSNLKHPSQFKNFKDYIKYRFDILRQLKKVQDLVQQEVFVDSVETEGSNQPGAV